jgi:hypothetical protein
MREDCQQLSALGEAFGGGGRMLEDAVDALETATHWVVEKHPGDAKAVHAVAVPYLKLLGTVAGGWLMARSAIVAHRSLDEPAAARDFLYAKIATARFYAEHILPQARAFADAVTSGADSVMAFPEDRF